MPRRRRSCGRRYACSLTTPETLRNLGVALCAQGKLPEAEAQLRQALRLRTDDVEAARRPELCPFSPRETCRSGGGFRQALQLRPDDVEARVGLSVALMDQAKMPKRRRSAGRHYS